MKPEYSALYANGRIIVTKQKSDNEDDVILILPSDISRLQRPGKGKPGLIYKTECGESHYIISEDESIDGQKVINAIGDAIAKASPKRKIFTATLAFAVVGIISLYLCFVLLVSFEHHFFEPPSTKGEPSVLAQPSPPVSFDDTLRNTNRDFDKLVKNTNHLLMNALPNTPVEPPVHEAASSKVNDTKTSGSDLSRTLSANIARAAARGIFTVNLSSGHDKTLYVFSDPECPYCRQAEPAIRKLASDFNVIIFPVSVIGKEKSAEKIASMLCQKDNGMKIKTWEQFFSPDAGMFAEANISKEQCELGNKLLNVNNTAFQSYKFPGTPWIISDKGQHIPGSMLESKDTLSLYLAAQEQQETASNIRRKQ